MLTDEKLISLNPEQSRVLCLQTPMFSLKEQRKPVMPVLAGQVNGMSVVIFSVFFSPAALFQHLLLMHFELVKMPYHP